jgi:uncharacterized membrane protein
MDATITPNRSLSRQGFAIVMGALIALNLVLATVFWSLGALPVPVFLGLDVLGVWIAFQVSYRGARLSERVLVTAEEVRVRYESPHGAKTVWATPTAFTGVAVEDADEHHSRVRLSLRERRLTVGAALSPKERASFGRALEAAMLQARAERWT